MPILKYKKHDNYIRCSIGKCKKQGEYELIVTTFVQVQSSLCERHFHQLLNEINLIEHPPKRDNKGRFLCVN